jgi:acetyltransferase
VVTNGDWTSSGTFGMIRPMKIEAMTELRSEKDLAELRELLVTCVNGGASIGFLAPLAADEAKAYWQKIAMDLGGGYRLLLVGRDDGGRIVGSAQAAFESKANGRHRGEVQKVMVLPSHRRQGLAAKLMREIEAAAQARKVWLLFLDTSDSHAGAREFYEALNYVYVGGIPGYALDPKGVPERNAIFYKTLA